MKITNLTGNPMRSIALALCAFAIGTTPMWSQSTQDAPPPPQSDGSMPPAHRGEQMQEHRLEMMAKHLNLTPDQVTQVKVIQNEGRDQVMTLHQDSSIAPADRHAKMKSIREAQIAKIRAILTDDQKPKFDAMVTHEQERMEHGRRGEGAPGGAAETPAPPPAS